MRQKSESNVAHKKRGQRPNGDTKYQIDTENVSYAETAEWTAKTSNIQKGRPNSGKRFQRMTIDLEEETVSYNPVDANEEDTQAINRLLNMCFLQISR